MSASRIGATVNLTFLLSALLLLHACGGGGSGSGSSSSSSTSSSSSSSSGSGNSIPILNLPASLDWAENQTFTYTIPANDDGDLIYSINQSPDVALFTLDASTGLLSASTVFDFESPTDANLDGIFEVSITVSDLQGETASGSFTINVQNIEEYEAFITFPVPGSNIGGNESNLNIRGYLVKDGVKQTSQPSDIAINVNDVTAIFETDDSGNWIAETPVQLGDNSIDVEVTQANERVFRDAFSLQNVPVANIWARVSDGISSVYAISVDGAFLLETTITNGDTKIISSASNNANCAFFDRLLLSPDGNKLSALCADTIQNRSVIVLIDLENSTSQFVNIDFDFTSDYFSEWVENDYLLIRPKITGVKRFYLVDVSDGSVKEFDVLFSESQSGYVSDTNLLIDTRTVYLSARRNEPSTGVKSVWASFELSPVINSTVETLEAMEETALNFNTYNRMSTKNGVAYLSLGKTLLMTDLDTGVETTLQLDSSVANDHGFSGPVVYIGNDYAIIPTVQPIGLFRINLITGVGTAIGSDPKIQLSNFSSVNQAQTELATYSYINKTIQRIDLLNYEIVESHDLTSTSFYPYSAFEYASFDVDNKTLLRSNLHSWSGEPPNDKPILLAYDIENQTDTPLLTTNDVQNHLNLSDARFTIGKAVATDDSNIIWFTMFITEGEGFFADYYDGIFSLNIQTREIDTLYFYTYPSGYNVFSSPSISDFSPELDGVLFVKSYEGYVKALNATGNIETLIESGTPYHSTNSPVIDNTNNLIYFTGLYEDIETGHADSSSSEIIEYNLDTGEQRLVASQAKGSGLNLIGLNSLNTQKKLIYGFAHGNLLVIDIYTGDRVIKAFD